MLFIAPLKNHKILWNELNEEAKGLYTEGCAPWLVLEIPATWEAEIGRIMFQGHPKQKLVRPHLNQEIWAWWCAHVILATQDDIHREA
jgi:hypothetical protein